MSSPVPHAVLKPLVTALLSTSLSLSSGFLILPLVLHSASVKAEIRQFDVPAGPLGQALSRYASQAGVVLSFEAGLTQGRQSAGLKGAYEITQGFNLLLKGTGLAVQFLDSKTARLEVIPSHESSMALDNISVAATQRLGATTEDSGSYTTGPMSTATKLPLSIRETPQSITIISRQRMDDRKIETLNDVLEETPGITVQRVGPQRASYFARGFDIDNIMYDGLPTDVDIDTITVANMAMYDRVEIVRGSTGLVQGAGNPSAAINLVRKRPTADTRVSITSSAGRWDDYRTEIDASSPLNSSGSIRGRTVLVYQNKDSFRDYEENESSLFYGILEADLSTRTLLTFGASYQKENNGGTTWGGLPVAGNGKNLHLPRSTNLVSKWEYWDNDTTFVFGELNHRFDNDWKLRFATNKSWSRLNMGGTYIGMNSDDTYNQLYGKYDYVNDQSSYDFFASGPFQLLGREHELVLGGSKRETYFDGHGGSAVTYSVLDIYNWDANTISEPEVNESSYKHNMHIKQTGTYLTTRLNLTDDLKFILGGRLDWYDFDSKLKSYGIHTKYKVTREQTRYAGLIYDLDKNHSIYASYTDIFKPQSGTDGSGNVIAPIDGKNYEMGIKGEYFEGALNTSISIYQLDQENRAQAVADQANDCPLYPYTTCYEASGKVRSRGVDLEINGALTPNWQVGAGYTYVSTKYKQDADESREGSLYDTDVPQHILKISTTYQLPGAFNQWYIGGSLYRQNAIYNKGVSNGVGYYIEQDAYTLVDLMLRYKMNEDLDARLNFNNVLDRKYYQSISTNPSGGTNIYGAPRNAVLTLKYTF